MARVEKYRQEQMFEKDLHIFDLNGIIQENKQMFENGWSNAFTGRNGIERKTGDFVGCRKI